MPNFSAAVNGMRVQDAVIDANNTLTYGVFNNVDIRSEHRFDELSTSFEHFILDGAFEFTDRLRTSALPAIPKPSTTTRCRRRCCSTGSAFRSSHTTFAAMRVCRSSATAPPI